MLRVGTQTRGLEWIWDGSGVDLGFRDSGIPGISGGFHGCITRDANVLVVLRDDAR